MKKNYLIAGGIILAAVLFGAYVSYSAYTTQTTSLPAGVLNSFVQCIKSKGIIFYGAFWCPHCQATKAEFGSAAPELPYVECSTPNESGQTQICIDKQITEYPTWILPDGTRVVGEHTLQELSTYFGCPLPSGISTTSTPISPSAASAAP